MREVWWSWEDGMWKMCMILSLGCNSNSGIDRSRLFHINLDTSCLFTFQKGFTNVQSFLHFCEFSFLHPLLAFKKFIPNLIRQTYLMFNLTISEFGTAFHVFLKSYLVLCEWLFTGLFFFFFFCCSFLIFIIKIVMTG